MSRASFSPDLRPSFTAFRAVIRKELLSVLRDRTIIIAILIQLFIASFSSVLLIGMLSLYDADSTSQYANIQVPLALVSPPGQDTALLTQLLAERGLFAQSFASLNQAQAAYSAGQVRAILVLPAPDGDQAVGMQLYLPPQEAFASVILNLMQGPLKRYENALRAANGVPMRYTDLTGSAPTTYEFLYTVILPILMLFPAFVAGGMVVDSLSEEVENNTLDTLLSAPLTLAMVVGAKITAALLLTVVQCAAWLALLRLNGVVILNIGLVLVLSVIIAGIVAAGAAFITLLLRDRERSQFFFSLALLTAASASFLLNLSPIVTLARLATGDYYTHTGSVLAFAAILLALAFATRWASRKPRA